MKIAVVLSGGAARGAFHLGVLHALEEKGYQISAVSGSSIGAIIAMSYASGVSPVKQLEVFKSKEFKKAFRFNSLTKGIFRIDQKKDILKKLVPVTNMEESKIPVHITATDLNSGKLICFTRGEAIPLCIASSAVVPFFQPIVYDSYFLVDGGIMDNFPLLPLKQYGLPIVGVDLHPAEEGFKNSMVGVLKRMLFLVWRASVKHQIASCDVYITHEKLSEYSLFRLKNLDALFELGYKTTMQDRVLDEIMKR